MQNNGYTSSLGFSRFSVRSYGFCSRDYFSHKTHARYSLVVKWKCIWNCRGIVWPNCKTIVWIKNWYIQSVRYNSMLAIWKQPVFLSPQGFRQEAKSRGGTLLTHAYIKDSTYSSNIQSVYYKKISICSNWGREESVGNDDVCARKYEMVRMT